MPVDAEPQLPVAVVDRILRYSSCDSIADQAFYARTSALLRTANTRLSKDLSTGRSGLPCDRRTRALQVFVNRLQQQDDTITRIDVSGEAFTPQQLDTLARAIAHHGPSSDICMNACSLGDAKAISVFEALMEKPRIIRLSFASNQLGKGSLRVLAKLIANQPEITHLDLSYNGFGEAGLHILMDALQGYPTLAHLRLRHCGLRTESLNMLQNLQSVREKSTAQNGISG